MPLAARRALRQQITGAPVRRDSALLTPGARASPTRAQGSSPRPLARRWEGRRRRRSRQATHRAPGRKAVGRHAALARALSPSRGEGGAALPPVRAVRAQGRAPSALRSGPRSGSLAFLFRVSPCRSSRLLRSVGSSRLPCRCSSTGSWLWPRPSAPGTPAGSRAARASAASWRCSSAASWPVSSATSARAATGSRASGA